MDAYWFYESEVRIFEPGPDDCGACGASLCDVRKKQRCGRCRMVYYCDVECQKRAWERHSLNCRAPPMPSQVERELEARECPICMENLGILKCLEGEQRVTLLECCHVFHSTCWSKNCEAGTSAGCPVCRNS